MNKLKQAISNPIGSVEGFGDNNPISLAEFWQSRNTEDNLLLDRLTIHNVSIFFAYASYRLNLSANHISVLSGLFSLFALIAASTMDTGNSTVPILTIAALSLVSYMLDCADGQLARATGTTSRYGAFLDRAMDLVGIKLQFGAFFIFVYRYYMAAGSTLEAQIWLFGGLAFVFFYLARFTVWQFFLHLMPETYEETKDGPSVASEILKCLIDHQVGVLAMVVFIISPIACYTIFTFQALLLGAIWLRFFKRGLQYTASK